MGTALTNLCTCGAVRGYGVGGGRWATTTAVHTLSQAVDPTCPEGGQDVAVSTMHTQSTNGQSVFTVAGGTALRAPLDGTRPVSATAWFKLVNAQCWPQWRLLMICQKEGANTTSTTLATGIFPAVGEWQQVVVANKMLADPATISGYLGLYPIGAVLGTVGAVVYANAWTILQRPAPAPGGRFWDGDTTEWEPDTVCAWTGTPGSSPSTWDSTRDQVGKFSKWDGAAEVPLPATSQWAGGAEVPADYVEAQTA